MSGGPRGGLCGGKPGGPSGAELDRLNDVGMNDDGFGVGFLAGLAFPPLP